MGGKSSGTQAPPAPVMPPQQDNNAEIMAMMGMMMESMANMPQAPALPPTPAITREPIIDWAERNEQLLAKTRADYNVDIARRKGRQDTILTSPLLDDEETTTTSLLDNQ